MDSDVSRRITRERLYEEVWAEPMTKVAAQYKVSGSFLARVCTRLNVPRPPRGYWAMVAIGRKLTRSPLPRARPGDELEWARDGQPRVAQLPQPTVPEESARKVRRGYKIPDRHPLTVGVKELMMEGAEPYEELLKPRKHVLVDIIVSKQSLDRALDVANALFLSMERRGHSVMLEPYGQRFTRQAVDEREKGGRERQYQNLWSPARCTLVFIGTVAYGVTIFEMTENVEARYQDGKYTRISEFPAKKTRASSYSWTTMRDLPTGRLCVQIYSPYPRVHWRRQWREKKAGDFSRNFSGVVKELEAEAHNIVQLFEKGERQAEIERQEQEARRRRWEREEAERQHRKAEEESHSELWRIIDSWARERKIEEFFADVERQIHSLQVNEKKAVLTQRLQLARDMIGSSEALQWFAEWKTPDEKLTEEQEERKRLRVLVLGSKFTEDKC